MNANFAAHAAFEVDFAPLLGALHNPTVDLLKLDAIDRANLKARLAAGAIVDVNNRQFFRNFLAWSFSSTSLNARIEGLHFVKSITILG